MKIQILTCFGLVFDEIYSFNFPGRRCRPDCAERFRAPTPLRSRPLMGPSTWLLWCCLSSRPDDSISIKDSNGAVRRNAPSGSRYVTVYFGPRANLRGRVSWVIKRLTLPSVVVINLFLLNASMGFASTMEVVNNDTRSSSVMGSSE